MFGLTFMFFTLLVIGGLAFAPGNGAQLAIGILLVISTLCNMITIGPVCYPIVAETPSGRLRYKTICIGRFVYNLTGLFHNSLTPRMLSPIGKSEDILDNKVYELTMSRMELGRQNRLLLRRHQPALQHLVLVPPSRDEGSTVRRDRSSVRE